MRSALVGLPSKRLADISQITYGNMDVRTRLQQAGSIGDRP